MIHPRNLSSLFSLVIPLLLLHGCFRQPVESERNITTIIYPDPPEQPRIQYLTSFSSSKDFKPPQTAFNKFIFGEEPSLPVIKPYGITVHNGRIYICDTGLGGMEILDLEDETFEYFVPRGTGKLLFPINCALDEQNQLYVADGNRKQVVIFDNELKFQRAITLEQTAKPTDVAVDDSVIYVSAVDDHSIHRYDRSTGNFLGKFPSFDVDNEAYLYQPANIDIHDSLIYVSDIGACKIMVFNKRLEWIRSFGEPGRGFGQFTRPKGIAADNNGNIFVVDAAFENVQLFNREGFLLLNFGGTYEGPGGMWLPAGITVDDKHKNYFTKYVAEDYGLEYVIFVTNQYGPDKISIYGFLEPPL